MSETEFEKHHQKLVRQILAYLIEHPKAKDTITGVTQWWIAKEKLECWREDVEEVLEALVERGWLNKPPPAHCLFELNQERLEEIERFLQESENQ